MKTSTIIAIIEGTLIGVVGVLVGVASGSLAYGLAAALSLAVFAMKH